jgi:hypothetical protein
MVLSLEVDFTAPHDMVHLAHGIGWFLGLLIIPAIEFI